MIDFATVVSRISVGRLCPSMTITTVTIETATERLPGISITMQVADAAGSDDGTMPLIQVYPVPPWLFEDEERFVAWVYERVKDVLVHELDEFFSYGGVAIFAPVHPLTDATKPSATTSTYPHPRRTSSRARPRASLRP